MVDAQGCCRKGAAELTAAHGTGLDDYRKRETFEPVTLGHIRGQGCRGLLVYCALTWCNHSARLEPDWLTDDTVVPALGPRMMCTACGLIGADVRPDWSQHTGALGSGGAHRH